MNENSNDTKAQVYCAYDELVEIVNLNPNPRNPNKHPEAQVKLLAKIIEQNGWRSPITVSSRSGMIVKGHCRYEAAKLLGLTFVPVDFQDYDSEELEWADILADNKIAEYAELDMSIVTEILTELDTGVIDMDLTGWNQEELERIMTWSSHGAADTSIPDGNEAIDEESMLQTKNECPKCGFKW